MKLGGEELLRNKVEFIVCMFRENKENFKTFHWLETHNEKFVVE
jgi:hypothetical protein